ncbi:MAG: hypothetical protein ACFB6R_06185 [Alphaproteobacteria bacterium]
MNRRALLGFFLTLPWLGAGQAAAGARGAGPRRIQKIAGPFVIVDGWVLNESDLPKLFPEHRY